MRAALLALLALAPGLSAAEPAGCPPLVVTPAEGNLLTPDQEEALGDAAHESLQSTARVIEDEQLQGHLEAVGARLLASLPPGSARFRFLLSDLPLVNAFALPGGRVYVTRKLVAAARDEDELAGVLAHELGHGLRHDGAASFSRLLQGTLGVARLGDRRDVFDKYHQVLESARRKPGAFRAAGGEEDRQQAAADTFAVQALARAGYRPEALADFWDRVTQARGRTGNWLSDLFGATPPEARRLREMLRSRSALAPACRPGARPAGDAAERAFLDWRAAVVAWDGLARQESLPGLVWRRPLEPPLQPDVRHVRFSPDGRFVLAQDEASVFVYSSAPFEQRFSVEAPGAEPARFSPDSRELVFHTRTLRVERWEVASGRRLDVTELARAVPCLETALSPDGRFLACFDATFRLTLLDVESGDEVLERKDFHSPGATAWAQAAFATAVGTAREMGFEVRGLVQLAFSPDGRYFLAGANRTPPLAFDLSRQAALELPGVFHRFTQRSFTFAGPDRLAALDPDDGQKSALLTFPAGEQVAPLALSPASRLDASADGRRLLLRPLKEHPVAAMDLETRKVFLANRLGPALDTHGDLYVNAVAGGTLELRRLGSTPPTRVAGAELPRSRLGWLRVAAVSPGLRWLVVSQASRSACWDLQNGERLLHLRGFAGAQVDDDGMLFADFPPAALLGRTLARVSLPERAVVDQRPIDAAGVTAQAGPLLLTWRQKDAGTADRGTLEARAARSGTLLWSRRFDHGTPSLHGDAGDGTVALAWSLPSEAAEKSASADPPLRARLAGLKSKQGDYLIETLEASSGRTLGWLVVETSLGSFRVRQVLVDGEWAVVADDQRRALLYSLATGQGRGKVFGEAPVLSGGAAGLLGVLVEPGRLAFYRLDSLEKRAELAFGSPLVFARFAGDGRRFLAVTSDQVAYIFDTTRW